MEHENTFYQEKENFIMQNNNFNNGAANNNSNNNGGFIMSTGTINTVDLFAEVVKTGTGRSKAGEQTQGRLSP